MTIFGSIVLYRSIDVMYLANQGDEACACVSVFISNFEEKYRSDESCTGICRGVDPHVHRDRERVAGISVKDKAKA